MTEQEENEKNVSRTGFQLAQAITQMAMRGKFRKDELTPSCDHTRDVIEQCSLYDSMLEAKGNPCHYFYRTIAALHNLIEDTPITLKTLGKVGIHPDIIGIVDLLTHKNEDSYKEYIGKLAKDPDARRVKVADIQCNLADDPTPEQVRKYADALVVLLQHADNDNKPLEDLIPF